MTERELATRLAAWTWAAETLGQPAPPERIKGLVEVTMLVRADKLKEALQMALESDVTGFLPSPGAVIVQAKKISQREYTERNQKMIAGRMDQAKLEANASPASSDHIQALRDKIKGLAKSRGLRGEVVETVYGWRPSNVLSDESSAAAAAGIAAVKADRDARGDAS